MNDYSDIKGHAAVIEAFRRASANGRVSHAYILSGARGIGKKTLANAFAKALLCEAGGDFGATDACGVCSSCKTFNTGNNPDVFYVRPLKTKAIGVDDIRAQVKANVDIKQYRYRYKVFIIENAHKMTAQAQNALLKTLEEPPEYAVFILLCETVDTMLPTIMSRCVNLGLRPLSRDDVLAYLTDNAGISQAEAEPASEYADGSIGRALELAGSEEFITMRGDVIAKLSSLGRLNMAQTLNMAQELEKYKDDRTFLDIAFLWYRDMLAAKEGGGAHVVQKDRLPQLMAAAAGDTTRGILKKASAVWQAKKQLEQNAAFRLTLEVMLLRLKES